MNRPDRHDPPATRQIDVTSIHRHPSPVRQVRADWLAVEEPLEIRLESEVFAVVLRTPGSDLELASGLLLAEHLISGPRDIVAIGHCDDRELSPEQRGNVVLVERRDGAPDFVPRAFSSSSSCGVCGRQSIDDLAARCPAPLTSAVALAPDQILELPRRLRTEQTAFDASGGLHAAAIFDPHGKLLVAREDVGRHNAVDKVIGAALRFDLLPLSRTALTVSGRASFEIVQKCWAAGIPVLAAVSAPSSLAVDLAERAGITLVGFVRDHSFNVYTHAHRIVDRDG